MKVKFLRQFATREQLAELREWILKLQEIGILLPNVEGPSRYFRPLGEIPAYPPALTRLSQDLQAKFDITGKCVDLNDPKEVEQSKGTPSFVGMQTEGGFVQQHVDGNIGEQLQFRCTLLVSKPDAGGRLLMAGTQYDMNEGDIYCFVSNRTMHGTTPVRGKKPRMACSLGFLVDKSFDLATAGGNS